MYLYVSQLFQSWGSTGIPRHEPDDEENFIRFVISSIGYDENELRALVKSTDWFMDGKLRDI